HRLADRVPRRERPDGFVGFAESGWKPAEEAGHREVDLTVPPVERGVDERRPRTGHDDVSAPEVSMQAGRTLRFRRFKDPGEGFEETIPLRAESDSRRVAGTRELRTQTVVSPEIHPALQRSVDLWESGQISVSLP